MYITDTITRYLYSFFFVGRTLLRNKTDRQDTAQTITILPSVPVNICLLIG